jgi:hypothetical protein
MMGMQDESLSIEDGGTPEDPVEDRPLASGRYRTK